MGEAGLVREDKINGTHEWMEEYGRVELEGKMALVLRRSTEGWREK